MAEDIKKARTGLIMITYAVLLLAGLFNLGSLISFIGKVISLISPFLYGIAIAYVLNLLMRLYERLFSFMDKSRSLPVRRLKRPLSILCVFLTLAVVIVAWMVLAIPQLSSSVSDIAADMPKYVADVERFLNQTIEDLGLKGGFWQNISLNWNEIVTKAGQAISTAFPRIFGFTRNIAGFIARIAAGILISIYLLAAKEKLLFILRKLMYAWLPKRLCNRLIDICAVANRTFRGYFSGMIINSLIVGGLAFVGMVALGIPNAFLLSMVLAVTGIIPIIGPLLGSILSFIIVLLVVPKKALLYAILLLVIQELDSLLIYPRVVGRSIGLGGIWILFSLLLGGSLFGIIGTIAGIPAFAVIWTVVKKLTHNRLRKKEIVIEP
ncbi:MAG: AI-2E family transporter [Clostridiaceae bacterium]|jgi:predicted PurR-regulated permease PerM|nr:AI-2E family transporter [Clostridiaceae bacterium]